MTSFLLPCRGQLTAWSLASQGHASAYASAESVCLDDSPAKESRHQLADPEEPLEGTPNPAFHN